ncbi:MAG TPA: 2-oxo-4-hydroxy-4-carboxy-5-ureidoimidazoline decarboxylase [Stellaceae bacterium]|nr:2-oxo-4-hydroxy-4-carboxy-5-ureidoimidazoline decarboxylase [Stellaceae bacterium]
MTAIDLAALNRAPAAEFAGHLANVYEHAPWVATAVAAARPFATAGALFAALKAAVRAASEAERLALIHGHPELAPPAREGGALTADSTSEQASAGLDRLDPAEMTEFRRLNEAYRAKFSFPFIICVRRHTKESVLANFARRLGQSAEIEVETALDEIDRIAALRLDALVAGEGRLAVAGRLSTHVLDTHAGKPADGVAIELRELSARGDRLITSARTNADGRTEAPVIAGRPLPIGRYELRFAVGAYFATRGIPLADPPFLDVVPVRFAIAEAEGHYHIPLLVTPWSYSTYRGS